MILARTPLTTGTLAALLATGAPGLQAQAPAAVRDAAALAHALDKLQVLGTVLYVAAHPDDENTAVLACCANGRNLRTAYLSLTRGGGGQNLIGPERDDALAALRTQELLEARRLDGAEQYFTRAVDFGYSKTPEETLAAWNHEAVLEDVVWTIRRLRPDVIITRFSPTQGGTHGHHTASARLALEAFRAAADPKRFPHQLATARPWQARRIVWNAYRPQPEPAAAPGQGVALDVGGYDPLLGKSYTELAAESRSMHRSQGFGAVASRGPRLERFEPLDGQAAKEDLLEGVDLSWARVPGGQAVGALLREARQAYRPERPEGVLPLLLKAKAALEALPPDPWVAVKRTDLVEAIRCAAGIWAEAIADRPQAAPGDPLAVAATVLARGTVPITWTQAALAQAGAPRSPGVALGVNQPALETFRFTLPAGTPVAQPYWLEGHPARPGQAPPAWAGLPEGPAPLTVTFTLQAEGVPFELAIPVRYRFRDPVLGERYQPLAVVPPVLVDLAERVQILGGAAPREVAMTVVAGKAGVSGRLHLEVPGGWRAEPADLPFALAAAGDRAKLATRLFPPGQAGAGTLRVRVDTGGTSVPARGLVRIDHPHIPAQTLFPLAAAKVARVDLAHNGRRIGYVAGAGDEVAQSLRPLGYEVDLLTDEVLAAGDLSGYDAIVVGIRAFNTRPRLAQLNQRLLDYVARGGTEVVQYNVDSGLVTEALGPFPFQLSRTRVAEETAPVTFLAPDHPVLNWPNKITPADFEGWVQERGLQFAQGWDPRYTAILSTHDAGEPASGGALLVARHGKGQFVYTGLSFFRQLPEGVPGAYRLFANLLALGHRHD